MQTVRKIALVVTTAVLFILLFKGLSNPSFLGTPVQYQTDKIPSKEDQDRQFDYLKDYEHPPADDIVIPAPNAALKIAYGHQVDKASSSQAKSSEEPLYPRLSVWHEKVNLHRIGERAPAADDG